MSFIMRGTTLNQNIKLENNSVVDNQTITGDRNQPTQTSTPLKKSQFYYKDIQESEFVSHDKEMKIDKQKSTRFLGNRAVAILLKWFHSNKDYPYPDETTTDILAREADISCKQVKKWFANKRVRSQLCCKPVHRHRKRGSSQNNDSQSITHQKGQNNNLIIPNIQSTSSKMNYQIGTPKTPINNKTISSPSIIMNQQQHLNGSSSASNSNLVHQMALYNPLVMMNMLASSSPLNYQQKPLFMPSIQQQISGPNQNILQNPYYYQNFIREYLQHQQQQQQIHHQQQQQQQNNVQFKKNNNNNDEIIKHKNDSVYYGDDEENNYSLESADDIKQENLKHNHDDDDDNLDDDDDCMNDEDVSIDIEDLNENNNGKNNKENLNDNLLIASKLIPSSVSSTTIQSKQVKDCYKLCGQQKSFFNKKSLENSTGSTTESYASSYTDSFNYSNGNPVIISGHNTLSKNSSSSPSSSVSPYYSASSSTNSSNSNTPNTQIYVGSNCVDQSENKSMTKKKLETKKINFAVIASLVD